MCTLQKGIFNHSFKPRKRLFAFPLTAFLLVLTGCGFMNSSKIEGDFHPGISNSASNTGPRSFTQTWPFDFGTTANYSYDTTKIDLTGGVCRLTPTDQVDDGNTASGFAGGSLNGLAWDSTNGYVRLTQTGMPTNNAKLDSSWAPRSTQLIGLWHLDETTTTAGAYNDFIDDSGQGNHAEVGGGVALGSTARFLNGVGLNGTNTSLEILPSVSLNDLGDFSTSAWIFPLDSPWLSPWGTYYGNILSKTDGVASGWNFALTRDTASGPYSIRFWRAFSTTALFSAQTNIVYPNNWYHVATTYSSATKTAKVFLNGIEIAYTTQTAGVGSIISDATSNFQVGQQPSSPSYFKGTVDEVALWNTALTASEVYNIYSRQSAKYSGTITSRVMDGYAAGQGWTTFSWLPTLPFFKELPDYSAGAVQNETSADYSSLVGSTGSIGDNNLMSGIVGLWHFDEGAGISVSDDSGQSNAGTAQNGPTWTSGKLSSAMTFNGSNQYVSTNTTLANSLGSGMSVSFWVNKLDTNIAGILNNYVGGSGIGIEIGAGNIPRFIYTHINGGNYIGRSTTDTLSVGQWYHVTATWDGSLANANGIKIYLNGIRKDTTNVLGGIVSAYVNPGSILDIGREYYSGAYNAYFKGSLDEFAIWSRVLHANEVLQLYRRGANRIKYQVRTCTSANAGLTDCTDGSTWKGPDGTNQTYFSELNNNTVALTGLGDVKKTLPSMLFSAFTAPPAANRYFQYRTILESDDLGTGCNYGSGATWCSPELKSVTIDPVHYASDSPTIIGKTGTSYQSLASFTETLGASCGSGIGYNLGVGAVYSSATWYYWNGSAWVVADGTAAQSNTAAVLGANVASFATQVGTGTVYFKAFLNSSGTAGCELDQLQINGIQ